MIGERLGSYEIIEQIGQGGMATVYRAYQPSMERFVAVKVIHANIVDDEFELVERFQREARLVARLEHPHLLPIYDYNLTYTPAYIVMRYLEGGTLKDILKQGRLPLAETGFLMGQIASALDYAHRQGVVHRDIKPTNIMIDQDGNAFVADFGIARMAQGSSEGGLTQTGMAVGTPHYMAPEQGMGMQDIDHRADIYALGVMLFEMVTGQLPFNAETPMVVIVKHINDPIPRASTIRADIPPELDMLLMRALAKDSADRFESASELMHVLNAAIAAQSGPLPGTPTVLRAAARESAQTIRSEREAHADEIQATMKAFERTRHAGTVAAMSETGVTPTRQNKMVTVLYANLAEYVEIIEYEGAEEAHDIMDTLWDRFESIVSDHQGEIVNRSNETLTAVWGVQAAHEDDPERAIYTALAMQKAMRDYLPDDFGESFNVYDRQELFRALMPEEETTEYEEPLPMQIAINTGLALLTPDDKGTGYNATGLTISVVNRLERIAEPGVILISHNTYRHVRGVFNVTSTRPLRIRGRRERLQTYRVQSAKPRAFRTITSGIEGVETALIGRDAEMIRLQDAFYLAVEDSETQVVTIVGEAGLGKSRLLYEFSTWAETEEADYLFFPGRATPEMVSRPYALLRNIFAYRFEIQDSDSPTTMRQKLASGIAGILQQDDAAETIHLIGYLLGFNFSNSPHLQPIKNEPERHKRGEQALGRFFQAAVEQTPTFMELEDIHWADDQSLDYLNQLARENPDLPLLIVCMARPSLYERRPNWGSGQRFHTRIDLSPLSRRDSRRLVKEILKKVEDIPKTLRDLIVERAEGNPFYIEELIKMLIEDRIIMPGDQAWRIETKRLANVSVPPTLVGLLQARLDGLLPDERTVLQRAAVVGHIFWSEAAAALEAADELPIDTESVLNSLVESEMIYPRADSTFPDIQEYIFANNMLREVIYTRMLNRQRQKYHREVAAWLIKEAGTRQETFATTIAEHYQQAGDMQKAALYHPRERE